MLNAQSVPQNVPAWVIELDRKGTAYHEAGHFVAARHFKIPVSARFWPEDDPKTGHKVFRGEMQFLGYTPLSPFRRAVICWAGPVAEQLVANAVADIPMARLLPEHVGTLSLSAFREQLEDIMDYLLDQMEEDISETDWQGIRGHPCMFRTLKTAANIIIKRYGEVEWVAQAFLGERVGYKRYVEWVGGRRPTQVL